MMKIMTQQLVLLGFLSVKMVKLEIEVVTVLNCVVR